MILLGGGPNRLNAAAHPPKSWAQLVFLGDYGANLRRPSSDAVGCAVVLSRLFLALRICSIAP